MRSVRFLFLVAVAVLLSLVTYVHADEFDAAKTAKYPVLNLGENKIKIDLEFEDWKLAKHVLVMGKDTWEAHQGGTRDNDDDLTGRLQIVYDEANLYFALIVKDDEFVAEGANPWENDGVQLAIDASGGEIAPGFPNGTTHLYNFSVGLPWQKEAGNWQGDAIIELDRDEANKQNVFEWQMPVEIFAKKGTALEAGMELAFAIIANDSDKNAVGQKGWIGWGNHTIVFGKNPEEMKTLVLQEETLAVDAKGKLATQWGEIKR